MEKDFEKANINDLTDTYPMDPLKYSICSFSSFSPPFKPDNIMINPPKDLKSRWSTLTGGPNEYITIKFAQTSLISSLVFAKNFRLKQCNIKEFRLSLGMEENKLEQVFVGNLKNNSDLENLEIKYQGSVLRPARFLKIEPLQTWGGFNYVFCIWYLEVRGSQDLGLISKMEKQLVEKKDDHSIKLCLKLLREKNLMKAFNELSAESGIALEHPLIGALYYNTVEQFDYTKIKELLQIASNEGLINTELVTNKEYSCTWNLLEPNQVNCECLNEQRECMSRRKAKLLSVLDVYKTMKPVKNTESETSPLEIKRSKPFSSSISTLDDQMNPCSIEQKHGLCESLNAQEINPGTDPSRPSRRSGHRMVVSNKHRKLYIFGGSEGYASNSEFWEYNIDANSWRLLVNSDKDKQQKNPLSRTNHCMAIDENSDLIYLIGGKILELEGNLRQNYCDFYSFSIQQESWSQISSNTEKEGGPSTFENGQLCFGKNLYLFGGLLQERSLSIFNILRKQCYNGLYSYDAQKRKWECLYDYEKAKGLLTPGQSENSIKGKLKSRHHHVMVYRQDSDCLYVYGGMRGKKIMRDLNRISLKERKLERIGLNTKFHAQTFFRGVYRESSKQIIFFSCFVPEELFGSQFFSYFKTRNSLFIFDLEKNEWDEIYQNEQTDKIVWQEAKSKEPVPRHDFDMASTTSEEIIFIYGGDPNYPQSGFKGQLSDFWALKVEGRPCIEKISSRVDFLLSLEQARTLINQSHRLDFNDSGYREIEDLLRKVNMEADLTGNEKDKEECKKLGRSLFFTNRIDLSEERGRLKSLFEEIVKLFPLNLRQPEESL